MELLSFTAEGTEAQRLRKLPTSHGEEVVKWDPGLGSLASEPVIPVWVTAVLLTV